MNDALDLHAITTVVPIEAGESENGAGTRGEWPMIAFTDDVQPIVFDFNVN
jgi:hypothetical protein